MTGFGRRPRRLALSAVACAAALLAAACGSSGHDPAKPTASTARPGPPASSPAAAPYTWSVDDSTALQTGGGASSTLASVLAPAAATGAVWQIAGTRSSADGSTSATVWTSPDAVTWTPVALPASDGDSQALAAATWGSRTIVVGSTGTGSDRHAAAWLSAAPDLPFTQIQGGSAFAPPGSSGGPSGGAEMDVVGAGGLGVFAAGRVAGQQAMWYSTDGRHWQRLPGAERVIDGATNPLVRTIDVGANGVYAAGSVSDGQATDAAVWSSGDGINWGMERASAAFTGNGDHTIASLVSLGNGFVASGGDRSGQEWSPASWISPNGQSWSQASLAFPMASGPRPEVSGTQVQGMASTTQAPAAATTATGTLAAVGGSTTEQWLWTSTDGTSWTSVPLPAAASASADWRASRVATDGSTTVLVDDSVGAPRVLVDRPQGWTEVTATPAAFGPPRPTVTPVRLLTSGSTLVLVAQVDDPGQTLGTESTGAAVFTSSDGSTWTAEATGPFAGHDVTDVADVDGGLVAVGNGSALTSTLGAGPTGAAAWTSPTGQAWTISPSATSPAAATPTFGGGAQGTYRTTAVTRLGSTVVAVGDMAGGQSGPASQPVSWTSADGSAWTGPELLNADPTLADAAPQGVCSGPQTVAAVGSTVGAGPGTQAAAWSSSDGTHWQPATVSTAPDPDTSEQMESCITAGNGFIGYGASTAAGGTDDPAVWTSDDGTHWTLQSVTTFDGTGLGPIKDLAVSGTTWLAVSGTGATSTAPEGGVGLWRTTDAGVTWQRLDTSGAPWTSRQTATVDRVLLTPTDAIVAGTVDGRLTVWLGKPTAPATGGSSSSTTLPPATPTTEPKASASTTSTTAR